MSEKSAEWITLSGVTVMTSMCLNIRNIMFHNGNLKTEKLLLSIKQGLGAAIVRDSIYTFALYRMGKE